MRLLGVFVPVALTLLTGCGSSVNPSLYTIAPVAGRELKSTAKVVVVQQIAIARYLDRTPIVRSSESYRLDVLANDWWGEPLAAMLTRILVEELGQRLPGIVVIEDAGAVSARPDVTVEVNVQRLDRDKTGMLLLMAQASLSYRRGTDSVPRSFRIAVPVASDDTAAQVAASSEAVGQLADGLAAMIARPRTAR